MKVAVFGAAGRMGRMVCDAVREVDDLELVAAIDTGAAGSEVCGLPVVATPKEAADTGIQVAVDFTAREGAMTNALWCAMHGVHAVIGTSGITEDDLEQLRGEFTTSNCLVAPNFAIGAVLMMKFAEMAAPWFETAEIIELHHDGKVDAPSGTAVATAQRMAAASGSWAHDPTEKHNLPESRGASGPAGIHVHAVRLRGVIASQEVILGTTGQTLSIRHDTFDRSSFMPGVVLACREIARHPGVTLGLDAFL